MDREEMYAQLVVVWRNRAERAEATLERVRALAERWQTEPAEDISARAALARELLAALDGKQP